LVRGLAGFGLGLMADGLLERGGRFSKLSKKDARALNQSAREKLLQFLEFRYAAGKPGDKGQYLAYTDTADDLFVSWCCTDALTQLDHNSVLMTAIRLCTDCVGTSVDEAEIRAQAVYIMGMLGRRTAHKHDLVSRTLLKLLREETTAHNVRAHGYAAQAVARLWIGAPDDAGVDNAGVLSGPADDATITEPGEYGLESNLSEPVLRKRAARTLIQCRDELENMMAESHHSWLRRKISESLGEIGTERALELLKQQVRLEMSRTRTLRTAIQLLNERIDRS
ncbi:MAG: HEAT repeat domain-containing protein, partial [Anaerolineae bacterium]